jgi:predicted nucleic acid-binding Zn ribbon protein
MKCPKCGKSTRKKIGAGAGIIFKGTGFYETDYKRKSGGKEPKKNGESAESKPAEAKKEEKKAEKPKED